MKTFFKIRKEFTAALIAIGMMFAVTAAQADDGAVTDKDLEVAVRSFSFAYGLEKGDISVEIVADPSVPESNAEAKRLQDIIGTGKTFAGRTVSAKVVSIENMGATKSRIAYIPHGLQKDYDTITQKAAADKLLTFSTDFACVESGKCVMGVTGETVIKIEISRSAASASQVEFSQALKLMIGEVN